jgi:hypothetical protein
MRSRRRRRIEGLLLLLKVYGCASSREAQHTTVSAMSAVLALASVLIVWSEIIKAFAPQLSVSHSSLPISA